MKNTRIMGLGLLDRPHGRILVAGLITAFIALVARSNFILDPAWSVDSYSNWNDWPGIDLFLRQGRIGQYLLIEALEAFGFDRNSSAGVLQGVGVALFALSAPFMFAAFSRREMLPIFPLVIAGSLFVLHPFQAEILTFPEASFFPAFACALGIVSVTLVATYHRLWWLGSMILLAALSIYQLALNYVCVMVLFGLLSAWVEAEGKAEIFWRKDMLCPFVSSALMISIGLALYLLSNKLIILTMNADQDGRAQLLGFADIGTRVGQVASLSREILRTPFLLDLPVASLLLWAAVACGWLILLAKVVLTRTRNMAIPLSLILLIPIAAMGVVLVGSTWWPVPRVLGGVVLIMAFGVYLALTLQAPTILRRWATVLAFFTILASVSVSYRIHADQIQVNDHDRYLARVIYQRLIETDGYSEALPAVIVNTRMRWTHPAGVKTVKGDMNISAFAVSWSIPGLFSVSTGRVLNFKNPDGQDEEMCKSLPAWPSPDAIAVLPDRALVCI